MNRKKFQAKLRASESYSFLRLRGVIDEDNHLASLIPKLSGEVLVVDASEVERINSCGVRDWVNWLHGVEDAGLKVVLIRTSPSIVTQINLVTNFVGGSVVYSFQAPYYCPACDREYLKLIETEGLLGPDPARAPAFRCSECGGVLDFDDLEESYFAFINATRAGSIDSRLKRLVDEVAPDLEAKIRALNEAGSAPLSGPLHTVGTLGSLTPVEPSPAPKLPPRYFELEEETERAHGGANPPEDIDEPQTEPPVPIATTGNALMVVFVVSAVVVIGLLIYFAVTGI